jgi:hypothetical protein
MIGSTRRVVCVFGCVLALFCVARVGEPQQAAQKIDLARFADVKINEEEASALVKRNRANKPTEEEAAIWVRVANSDKHSDVRRRRAVFQLFDRHVHQGMTLGELAKLLAGPTWLKRENISRIKGPLRGYCPICTWVPGESVFYVSLRKQDKDVSAIYLRVEDFLTKASPTEDMFYDTLQGKKKDAAGLKIAAVVVSPGESDEPAYVKHRNEGSPKSGSPHRWELVFQTDNIDEYARQLDFFQIELGVLMPEGKIAYAFRLSKSKPDSRIVDKPHLSEKRFYLWRKYSNGEQEDRELLTRAGIEPGEHLILKFLPRQIEQELVFLERTYRGADPWKIEKTRFGVKKADGNGFQFYVLEQVPRAEKNKPEKARAYPQAAS